MSKTAPEVIQMLVEALTHADFVYNIEEPHVSKLMGEALEAAKPYLPRRMPNEPHSL